MIRVGLGEGGQPEKLTVRQGGMMDSAYLEHSLGHGPGLIKGHGADLGKGLKIVGTLHQYAFVACTADACEEA